MLKTHKIFSIVSVVAILAIGLAAYFYYQLYIIKKDPRAATQNEVTELVKKISQLIVLPSDEIPTIATVADPEALKDQAFFSKAEKGDKVLIYAQAKKAILYSVTTNKILDVAPLNIGEKTTKSTQTPTSGSASISAPTSTTSTQTPKKK